MAADGVIVVAVIVIVASYFVRVPLSQPGSLAYAEGGPGRGTGAGVGRTYNGRLSKAPADSGPVPALCYVPLALATITSLERRWRPAAAVALAGLVILLIHLALPPGPDQLG